MVLTIIPPQARFELPPRASLVFLWSFASPITTLSFFICTGLVAFAWPRLARQLYMVITLRVSCPQKHTISIRARLVPANAARRNFVDPSASRSQQLAWRTGQGDSLKRGPSCAKVRVSSTHSRSLASQSRRNRWTPPMVIQPRAAGVGGVHAPTKRASEFGSHDSEATGGQRPFQWYSILLPNFVCHALFLITHNSSSKRDAPMVTSIPHVLYLFSKDTRCPSTNITSIERTLTRYKYIFAIKRHLMIRSFAKVSSYRYSPSLPP